jgi:hypothetical protein
MNIVRIADAVLRYTMAVWAFCVTFNLGAGIGGRDQMIYDSHTLAAAQVSGHPIFLNTLAGSPIPFALISVLVFVAFAAAVVKIVDRRRQKVSPA